MLNRFLSQAGEKNILDIKSSFLAFLPLSAISPDVRVLQEKYLAHIQARIDGGESLPGLRKQYELQLDQIKAQVPSHEILLFPCISAALGERNSFELRNPINSPHPEQQSLSLRGNMHLFGPCQTNLSPAVLLCASGIHH